MKKSELRELIKEELLKESANPRDIYYSIADGIVGIQDLIKEFPNDAGLKAIYRGFQKQKDIFSKYLDTKYGKDKWD